MTDEFLTFKIWVIIQPLLMGDFATRIIKRLIIKKEPERIKEKGKTPSKLLDRFDYDIKLVVTRFLNGSAIPVTITLVLGKNFLAR
jgi:hypothetical protein